MVSFQWIEHRLRQIGWLITDPKSRIWPSKDFRDESNVQLLNKIEIIYVKFIEDSKITNKNNKILSFKKTIASLHENRRYRNLLLHSAYIEINNGQGEEEIWRSNPKLKYSDGKAIFDTETLTCDKIDEVMLKMANDAFAINICYTQALHLAGTY